MTSHLLAIAVGPVQEFIAAARRTRDLWLGSYLLSEISRAVACSVKEQGAKLIFPASLEAENVANVILAELDTDKPGETAFRAKRAAQRRWQRFAGDAKKQVSDEDPCVLRHCVWDEQIDDVIEFYASWIIRSDDYPKDRSAVMRLLAGRKSCRDFLPAKGHAGLPKSSLDGQRETVLHPQEKWQGSSHKRFRIRKGEQLDVVGVVKRTAEGHRPYPSVSRIAADPWLRGQHERLNDVILACRKLKDNGVIRQLDTNTYPFYNTFPYEGSVLYPGRHHELLEGVFVPELQKPEFLGELRIALERLPEPNPYLAVLVADGDKMGAALGTLKTPDENRLFSKKLADFAGSAKGIVEDHNGILVYAGGDDVLAFLPVDNSLVCARALHDVFCETMSCFGQPTLSVGIAIAHFMEHLEDLLGYGRAAEKAAKDPNRDGLAIHLHKRGGAPIYVRSQWDDLPDERLARYAELLQAEAIPTKLPYELRRLADVYEGWVDETLAQALRGDVLRVIRDKQPRAGKGYLKELEQIVAQRVSNVESLCQFAEELLIAKQVAVAYNQAGVLPPNTGR